MKVLHVLASNKYSGAENVVCQIIQMFKGEIDMAYCSPDGEISTTLSKNSIKFLPIKKLNKKELKRVIKEYQPDVIHAHDFRASVIASNMSKKIKVISHLHNNAPWLKKYGLKTFLYASTCKKYSKIMTVSESVFNEFLFGEKFKDKLTVLGNPINTTEIQKKAIEYEINQNFDIGFCGRLTVAKNPTLLLDIIEKVKIDFPNVRVAVVGDGELKQEFNKNIEQKSLTENVKTFGFQENPYPIIKQCKLLLLPSLWEGFGLVAVEALSLGVPVVCSRVGGLPNIVGDDCGKLCDTIQDYCKEISKILSNGDYQKAKSIKAKNKAELLNNIAEYKNKLIKTYQA